MSENPKKLSKETTDKVLTPEQAMVNASITQAAAMMNLAESANDIADAMDAIRLLAVKIALKTGAISPEEENDFLPLEEEEDDGEPETK